MSVDSDARELLLKAADHIETYGLHKGNWADEGYRAAYHETHYRFCPACAGGALAITISNGVRCSPNVIQLLSARYVLQRAEEILDNYLDLSAIGDDDMAVEPRGRIVKWNDQEEQTAETVSRALREAAQDGVRFTP